MGKIRVEVCLISARGLQRASSWLKHQWYAVGWIDSNNKYCTKIDVSGNANPVWRTKFSALIDPLDANFSDLALNVEVYSRDPLFLRERLLGTATVILKEFLEKYLKDSEVPKPVEEVGSFHLRKKKCNKPQGFVDISIQISEEREKPISYPGDQEGVELMGISNGINLNTGIGAQQTNVMQLPKLLPQQFEIHPQAAGQCSHTRPAPRGRDYPNFTSGASNVPDASNGLGGETSYPPPPPPPPSNVGYVPSFWPRPNNGAPSYINLPSSGPVHGYGRRPGFGMGLGVGALAGGAMIFGDNFVSGFDVPGGLQDPSLIISADPPF